MGWRLGQNRSSSAVGTLFTIEFFLWKNIHHLMTKQFLEQYMLYMSRRTTWWIILWTKFKRDEKSNWITVEQLCQCSITMMEIGNLLIQKNGTTWFRGFDQNFEDKNRCNVILLDDRPFEDHVSGHFDTTGKMHRVLIHWSHPSIVVHIFLIFVLWSINWITENEYI